MTALELIAELQRVDPKAVVKIRTYDNNKPIEYPADYVDWNSKGEVVIA